MKHVFACLAGILLLAFVPSHAHAVDDTLSRWWVSGEQTTALDRVAREFEVRRGALGGYEVIVPDAREAGFRASVSDAVLLERDIEAYTRWVRENMREGLPGYHTFEMVEAKLKQIARDYPEIASMGTYGTSLEGRPLFYLKISKNARVEEDEPNIMLLGGTHGDEFIGVEVVLGIMDGLVKGYGLDPRLTRLVDSEAVYIMPVVNPDGFVRGRRHANGIDPNRDYPWQDDPNHISNPCIANLIRFFEAHAVLGAVDYHASGEMVMYPWAWTREAVSGDDAAMYEDLSRRMAATNGYEYGQISRLMYIALGSSVDFFYWKKKAVGLGIELAHSKAPHKPQEVVQENLDAAWVYLEHFLD
jgi:hypothetical protein